MIANRVKETTATTGTGSFTTSGAVAGFQTFNTAFGTDRRFVYWAVNDTDNEWETGIGYLSAATTLVREKITDNSSAGVAAINFTTAPSLFCSINEISGTGPAFMYNFGAGDRIIPTKHKAEMTTGTLTTDRLYYVPFVYDYGGLVDGIGIEVTTGAGSGANKIHLALYDVDPTDGSPYKRIFSGIDIDPSTTGVKTISFTAQYLPKGTYWMACWSDTNPTVRGHGSVNQGQSNLTTLEPQLKEDGFLFKNSVTSLTVLADPATAPTVSSGAATSPIIFLEAV